MYFSDDPVRDAERYYEALEQAAIERRERLPYCDECGKKIETEYIYIIGDEFFCEDCMDKHRHYTDDFLDE